ncbi:uncharacterized protein [Aquarana catesbeiana]|uniref:uncharacterized protein isoform X2 n=1 Tax=Aquarana catesbeiana TaxID=8400 RepID=UPI003CC9BFE3
MMTTAMCPLCVLLLWALLCPGRGNVPEEIFTRPGSDLLLPNRLHLTLNHTNTSMCDQIEWKYKDLTKNVSSRILIHRRCTLRKNESQFSNMRISENGSLNISDVTLENDGIYSAIIHRGANRIQEDEYTVHVEVPVSGPDLNVSCLWNGSAEISCRVEEGTKPNISLSVIGGFQERYSASANNITAIVESPGPQNITCTVENGVSQSEISKAGVTCPVPVSDPVLDVRCLQNGSAEISCWVEKGTDPSINLTVNGELKVYHLTGSERTVRIIVPPVSPSDSWNISCSAQNAISRRSTNRTRDTCSDPLSAPRLNVSCNNIGSASVSCVLEENKDVSYQWTVNGKFLPGNHSRNITITNEGFISGPLNVSCSVNNSVSKKESNNANIFCPAPPSTPQVIFSCQNNGSVIVSCVVEKDQNVTYKWTVNGTVFYRENSSNVTFSKEELKTVPMNVSCSVQNSVSMKESNTTQISCPAPPSTPQVIFSCQKNGSVIVSCVVEKDQNVTYKWTVNGTVFYRENSSNVTFSKEELKTVPMNVSCSVQNSVSMKESNTTQISCPDESCFNCLRNSLIGGSVALLLTMPPVFIAHWCILHGMKKKP